MLYEIETRLYNSRNEYADGQAENGLDLTAAINYIKKRGGVKEFNFNKGVEGFGDITIYSGKGERLEISIQRLTDEGEPVRILENLIDTTTTGRG